MNRDKIREALLGFVWIENESATPAYIDDDVTNAVSQAFQAIWTAPLDYYRRKSTSFSTAVSTDSYTLTPGDVQEILTPVKIGTSHLRPLRHRSDLDHYATRYNGAASDPAGEGQPVAFYVERTNNAGNDDLSAVKIFLSPVPDAVYSVTYDYVGEAPSYSATQMQDSAALEFPHGYVESIFLPIARFYMMDSHYFHNERDRNREQRTTEEYKSALMRLGYADPLPAEASARKEVSR